jgi:hypothetical protein
MPQRADRRLRSLLLARDCALLGARTRTIHHVTGLSVREAQRLFFPDPARIPRGRAPDSPEWYHGSNLLHQVEASLFVVAYRRLRSTGFGPGDSLVGAYRHYQCFCHRPYRVSFDRAFDLAAHTDGIWVAKDRSLSVVNCPHCDSDYLDSLGAEFQHVGPCPFCRLCQRHRVDPRVRGSFPIPELDDPDALKKHVRGVGWPHRSTSSS